MADFSRGRIEGGGRGGRTMISSSPPRNPGAASLRARIGSHAGRRVWGRAWPGSGGHAQTRDETDNPARPVHGVPWRTLTPACIASAERERCRRSRQRHRTGSEGYRTASRKPIWKGADNAAGRPAPRPGNRQPSVPGIASPAAISRLSPAATKWREQSGKRR